MFPTLWWKPQNRLALLKSEKSILLSTCFPLSLVLNLSLERRSNLSFTMLNFKEITLGDLDFNGRPHSKKTLVFNLAAVAPTALAVLLEQSREQLTICSLN